MHISGTWPVCYSRIDVAQLHWRAFGETLFIVDLENIQIRANVPKSPQTWKLKLNTAFLLKAQIIALSLNLYICMYLSSKCADGQCRKEQPRNPIISYLLDVK